MTAITAIQDKVADLIRPVFKSQQDFFASGATRSYKFRVQQLKKLKAAVKKHEAAIYEALKKDLSKPVFESYVSETGIIYQEINHTLKHLKEWMEEKTVSTSMAHFPSSSKIIYEPLGTVLIIAPWNYPFHLMFAPLVTAISTGNTAILKPSEFTVNTAMIIEKIIKEVFEPNYIHVVQGEGVVVIPQLLDNFRFDHIFFTGSVRVGKIIAQQAAKTLTPVTLELGGKSPAVVDENASLAVTAKRLIFGKLFNSGQTCVAPDYLLVHENIKDKLIAQIKKQVTEWFGENPQESDSLGRIVDHRRFDILVKYLEEGEIVMGGQTDRADKFIAPTLIDNVSMEDELMKTEIFGPILPILTYSTPEEAIEIIKQNPFPLALYVFTSSSKFEEKILSSVRFGGGCVNNTIVHLSNPNLPFGGVGYSGMGRYHGEEGFKTLSHQKSIMKTNTMVDLPVKYPPYTDSKLKVASKFLG